VEITQRLADASKGAVESYHAALRFHYALWKWQHISEQASLAFLRRILATHDLVEPNPEPGWIVNRGVADYHLVLGDEYRKHREQLPRKTLTGHVPHDQPQRIFDSGSGNNTACYEGARPSILTVGSGLSLVFSVDGTIRNWLREPLRARRLQGYRSQLAAHVCKLAEIWSVARLVSPASIGDFDPIAELSASVVDGTVASGTLMAIAARTEASLTESRDQMRDGDATVTAIALGYLLDAMAGRVRMPNGMQFSYEDAAQWAGGIENLLTAVARNRIQTRAGTRLVARAAFCSELANRIGRHLQQTSLPADIDVEIAAALPEIADQFKATAFELRARQGETNMIEALHFVGNELWRWHFFLLDLSAWQATPGSTRSAAAHAALVRAWLERPWGILRPQDMKLALAEGFEPSEAPPRLLAPLVPLLREGVDPLVKASFGAIPEIAQRLERFIAHRCQLCHSRAAMEWINYEDQVELTPDRELADLLVELLTLWYYAQPEKARRQMFRKGLLPLATTLQGADWLTATSLPQPSRRQLKSIERYRQHPKQTASELFEFEPNTDLTDRLDVFPTEEFWILKL
jgi:hypothetical protein